MFLLLDEWEKKCLFCRSQSLKTSFLQSLLKLGDIKWAWQGTDEAQKYTALLKGSS